MNPALPFSIVWAAAVAAAAVKVFSMRRITTERGGSLPIRGRVECLITTPHTTNRVATSEPGDGASRSNVRTGARAPLLGPVSKETNFAATRKLAGMMSLLMNAVHAARLTASVDEQPLQPRRRDFCRVEKMESRRAHNAEVVGSSPTPATTLPVAGLVATPRRVEAVASLPAWSLLRINPKLISGGNHIAG